MSYLVGIFHSPYLLLRGASCQGDCQNIQNNDVFVDFAILQQFDWQHDLLDLKKRKLMSTFNQLFCSRTFCGSTLTGKHTEWWYMYESTKKKSSFALDIDQPIWPWEHIHRQALREVDWKLFVQVFSILNDCLLGTHGPRYCTDLVCSIYLPIMIHLPTSLPIIYI